MFYAVGVISGGVLTSIHQAPWYEQGATGLPAFQAGRWWTIVTSPFFADPPYVYLTLAPLVIGALAWGEWKFGSLRTIGIFAAGHIVGVLGASVLVLALAQIGWGWATTLATSYDVGPSCGALAVLVVTLRTLPAPWRLRTRALTVLWVTISALYMGNLYDIEHAVTMLVALAVGSWLPEMRRPAGRPTEREWRLITFFGLIAIGATQVLDLVVPYDGPMGHNQPVASVLDVVIDVVVILLIADGVRRGYRAAWVAALGMGALNVLTAVLLVPFTADLVELEVIEAPMDIVALAIAPAVL